MPGFTPTVAVTGSVARQVSNATPLYCDLDGSLLATDTLWECVVRLVKSKPALFLRLPFWLLKGKAFLKRQLASHVALNPASMPYHESVVAFLTREVRRGREVILATGSDRFIAEDVATHLGLFGSVIASDGRVNLTGRAKLAAILNHTRGEAFDYIGDSKADLPIWKQSSHAFLVRPSRQLAEKVTGTSAEQTILWTRPPFLRNLLRALRVHQWAKNALLLVPLMLAHQITDPERVAKALLACLTFCFAASAVYIVNDLLDLDSDRRHPQKRKRPIASGALPISTAVAIVPIGIAVSLFVAVAFLSPLYVVMLLRYLGTTTVYSVYLKRVAILDVLVLAGLYTLRVLAGAIAVDVPVSPWFLAFSMFFFISLAFVKRYAELRLPSDNASAHDYLQARGYFVEDAELLRTLGPTSGYLAVAVLALYMNSPEVLVLYSRPAALWLIGPLLLYWVTRVWFLAHRGQMHGDPVVFALTDRPSYALAAVLGTLLLLAALT